MLFFKVCQQSRSFDDDDVQMIAHEMRSTKDEAVKWEEDVLGRLQELLQGRITIMEKANSSLSLEAKHPKLHSFLTKKTVALQKQLDSDNDAS